MMQNSTTDRLFSREFAILCIMRQKLEVELGPRMVGKNHAEIAIEGRLIHDEIREVLDNNIANYQSEELPIEPVKQQAED